MRALHNALLAVGCSLAMGCSDGSDRRSDTPSQSPEETGSASVVTANGLYQGRIVTDDAELALISVVLASNGTTAITISDDDSGAARRILWGKIEETADELHFRGTDSEDDSEVALTFQTMDEALSGTIRLTGLVGEATTTRVSYAGPDTLSGDFGRQDSLEGLSAISIEAEGVLIQAPCEGKGAIMEVDQSAGIQQLSLPESCLGWEALLTATVLEDGSTLLELNGANGLITRLYSL